MKDIMKEIEKDELKIYNIKDKLDGINDLEVLDKIYKYIKHRSKLFYNGKYMHPNYSIIKDALCNIENYVKGNLIDSGILSFNNDINNFIEYLVFEGRKYLIYEHYPIFKNNKEDINLNLFNFTNCCKESSLYIKKICDDNNIKNYLICIYPGYTDIYNLYNGYGFHYINLVYYNNKYYLIDLTYSQFFYKNRSSLERIGIVNLTGPNVGRFMLLNNNIDIANKILKDGYIELDENIFKSYLDAFTISFRNGLYYENTNDYSFKTNYSIEDYLKFLCGYDNQINHEGLENLGYQKRPLKKNISFGGKYE